MFFFFKQVRISPEKDWCSHQCPYGGILPQVAAVSVDFYVSTGMIAWWVSVQCDPSFLTYLFILNTNRVVYFA